MGFGPSAGPPPPVLKKAPAADPLYRRLVGQLCVELQEALPGPGLKDLAEFLVDLADEHPVEDRCVPIHTCPSETTPVPVPANLHLKFPPNPVCFG